MSFPEGKAGFGPNGSRRFKKEEMATTARRFKPCCAADQIDSDGPLEIFYPFWAIWLARLGVPLLTLAGLWLISRALWAPALGATQLVAEAALSGVVLYQCAFGWVALRFMDVRLIAADDGLRLRSKRLEQFVPWASVGRMTHYGFATVMRLSDRQGRTLIYAFSNMKNLPALRSIARGVQ